MFDQELIAEAEKTLAAARAAGALITTAESCTGGLVAGVLTAVAGSSDAVFGGYVTYANCAKLALGVPEAVLTSHGAVSEAVARALAQAARARAADADPSHQIVSVAVTGVAGPGGGSAEKPVGLVHFAAASSAGVLHREARMGDLGREKVRHESILISFSLLRDALNR